MPDQKDFDEATAKRQQAQTFDPDRKYPPTGDGDVNPLIAERDLDVETKERVETELQEKARLKQEAADERNAKRLDDHLKNTARPVHYYDFRLLADVNHQMGAGPYAALVTQITDDKQTANLKIIAPKIPIHDQADVPYRETLPEDPAGEKAAIDDALKVGDGTPHEFSPLRFWTLPG